MRKIFICVLLTLLPFVISGPQYPNILITPGDGVYRPHVGVTVNLTEFPATKPGTSVANFHAFSNSPSTPNGHEYFIVPSTNPQKLFSIDPHEGLLTVSGELDRETKPFHIIRVGAMDLDKQVGYTAITIFVNDLNDNAPELILAGTAEIAENQPVGTLIVTLLATDRDGPDNSGPFKFGLVSGSDKVTLVYNPNLDNGNGGAEIRSAVLFDYEAGPTHFEVSVRVTDNGTPPLSTVDSFNVKVLDVNDIIPQIKLLKTPAIFENEPPNTVVTTIVGFDPEAAPNSGPFTFQLASTDVPFELVYVAALDNGMGGAHVRSKIPFDYESGVISYKLSIQITDNGEPKLTGTYDVVVDILDVNDDKMVDADMQIQIVTLNGEFPRSYIGSAQVAVDSTAGFNPVDKTFDWEQSAPEGFSLDVSTGKLFVEENPLPGAYRFTVKVSDAKTGDFAFSSIGVKITDVTSSDVSASTSVRLTGVSSTNFIQPQSDQSTLISRFTSRLADIFESNLTDVKLVSVMPTENHVDIFYAVRNGTSHIPPLLLDTMLTLNRRQLETELSADVKLIGIQSCVTHGCPGKCENFPTVTKRTSIIERIGYSTLITPVATITVRCHSCKPAKSQSCDKNSCSYDGVCYNTDTGHFCQCGQPHLQGPECQYRTRNFNGNGYILTDPLTICGNFHLSIDFITSQPDGVLIYAGPVSFAGFYGNHNGQFFALLLKQGRPVVTGNFGSAQITAQLPIGSVDLSDGRWHSIDIFLIDKKLELIVDKCASVETAQNFSSCRVMLDGVRGESATIIAAPMHIGGLTRTGTFDYPPIVAGSANFAGCIEDFTINDQTVDLYKVVHEVNSSIGCPKSLQLCNSQKCYRGKCRADYSGHQTCLCDPGWAGSNCDKRSDWTYFNGESFIEYLINTRAHPNEFYRTAEFIFVPMSANCTLLEVQNSEKQLETRIELEEFELKYVRSTGENVLSSSFNQVVVKRHRPYRISLTEMGHRSWISLDSQLQSHMTGVDHVEYPPMEEAFLGAESQWTQSNYEGCVADLRWNGVGISTDPHNIPPGSTYEVVAYANVIKGCPALSTCGNSAKNFCPFPLECFDHWKGPICVCSRGYRPVVSDLGQLEFCEEINPQSLMTLLASGAGIAMLLFVLACVVLFLVAATLWYQRRQASRNGSEKSVDKIVNYNEEGGGETDLGGFDVVALRKPIQMDGVSSEGDAPSIHEMAVDIGDLVIEPRRQDSVEIISAEIPLHSTEDLQDLGLFISTRLNDTEVDPVAPPFDEIRPYEFEGDGVSGGGSLSSLSTAEDFAADLNRTASTWGSKFGGLAEICEGSESE